MNSCIWIFWNTIKVEAKVESCHSLTAMYSLQNEYYKLLQFFLFKILNTYIV